MKTRKTYIVILLLLTTIGYNACVKTDDFEVPEITTSTVEFNPNDQMVDIGAILANYNQNGSLITFEPLSNGGSQFISGYVISSDEGGNFYKEIVIQNEAENPTSGIVVQVDLNPLFTLYEFGRKVYIKLDGLSANVENGVLQLGIAGGDRLEQIPSTLVTNYIIRTDEVATIVPLDISINDLAEDKENLFVRFSDMQFQKDQVITSMGRPLTFAGETTDQFDGERTLVSCTDNSSVLLSTSTFSDFKSASLPIEKGTIEGIISRDYFDGYYVLSINSPDNINFTDTTRCDPVVLECTGSTSTSTTIFEEDFEGISDESNLDGQGWTNINTSGGSERFELQSFSGDKYLKISAFGTGEDTMVSWLITPDINLDNSTEEELTFNISSNYDSGIALTVYITDNYSGDPETTDWTQLDVSIPIGGSGFGSYVTLGTNISCLDGNVRVAFKYNGGASSISTRYHIDDIKVTGN